jgi:hypothetical protein
MPGSYIRRKPNVDVKDASSRLDKIMIQIDHWSNPDANLTTMQRMKGRVMSRVEDKILGRSAVGAAISEKLRKQDTFAGAMRRQISAKLYRVVGGQSIIGSAFATSLIRRLDRFDADEGIQDKVAKSRGRPDFEVFDALDMMATEIDKKFSTIIDSVRSFESYLEGSDDRVRQVEDNREKTINELKDSISEKFGGSLSSSISQIDNMEDSVRRIEGQVFEHETKLAVLQKDISFLKRRLGMSVGGGITNVSISGLGLDAANDNKRGGMGVGSSVLMSTIRAVGAGFAGAFLALKGTKLAGAIRSAIMIGKGHPLITSAALAAAISYSYQDELMDALKAAGAAVGTLFNNAKEAMTGVPQANDPNAVFFFDEKGVMQTLDKTNPKHQKVIKELKDKGVKLYDKNTVKGAQREAKAYRDAYAKRQKEIREWKSTQGPGAMSHVGPPMPRPQPLAPFSGGTQVTPGIQRDIDIGYNQRRMGGNTRPGTFRGGRGGPQSSRSLSESPLAGNIESNTSKLSKMSPGVAAAIRAIGMTETHLRPGEAYSEALNQAHNNANVRRYGKDKGSDYGFFQNNKMDSDRLTKKLIAEGMDRGEAQRIGMALSGRNLDGSKASMEDQMIAMDHYLRTDQPATYEKLKSNDPLVRREGMNALMRDKSNFWFGLRDRPHVAIKEFERSLKPGATVQDIMPELFPTGSKVDPNDPIGQLRNQRRVADTRDSDFYVDGKTPFNYANTREGMAEMGAPGDYRNQTQITLKNGHKLTTNKAMASRVKGMMNEAIDRGYDVSHISSYNPRNKRGGSSLSMHAWGSAFDVNPGANPFRGGGRTDMPPAMRLLAKKWGFAQLANDRMHFENVPPGHRRAYALELLRKGIVKGDDPIVRSLYLKEGWITEDEAKQFAKPESIPEKGPMSPAEPLNKSKGPEISARMAESQSMDRLAMMGVEKPGINYIPDNQAEYDKAMKSWAHRNVIEQRKANEAGAHVETMGPQPQYQAAQLVPPPVSDAEREQIVKNDMENAPPGIGVPADVAAAAPKTKVDADEKEAEADMAKKNPGSRGKHTIDQKPGGFHPESAQRSAGDGGYGAGKDQKCFI